jgi:FkbM family methyltransferase
MMSWPTLGQLLGAGWTELGPNCDALASPVSDCVRRWRTPSGVTLESIATHTSPPFMFAFSPVDRDADKMMKHKVLEPVLTHAWHEATWKCCEAGGEAVDVGGNFGWFTLWSLALGCRVTVFEPVPQFVDVMTLGLALNPGFGPRVTLHQKFVYDGPSRNFSMQVPTGHLTNGRKVYMGMTGMRGEYGVLKSAHAKVNTTQELTRPSVRVDDVVPRADVCILKADVEGYEPQVVHSARRLLSQHRVDAVQVELSHVSHVPAQRCEQLRTVRQLFALGYAAQQIAFPYLTRSRPLPSGDWRLRPGPWAAGTLRTFPGEHAKTVSGWAGQGKQLAAWKREVKARSGDGSAAWDAAARLADLAYRADFATFSTNLLFRRGADTPPPLEHMLEWPPLACTLSANGSLLAPLLACRACLLRAKAQQAASSAGAKDGEVASAKVRAQPQVHRLVLTQARTLAMALALTTCDLPERRRTALVTASSLRMPALPRGRRGRRGRRGGGGGGGVRRRQRGTLRRHEPAAAGGGAADLPPRGGRCWVLPTARLPALFVRIPSSDERRIV